ncbi:phage tail family protein, partial [Enterococcus sp. ARL09-542]
MVTVTYAGYDITKYMIVTSLDRGLLPEIDYQTQKVGRSDGEKYVDRTIGRRTIPMGFALVGEVNKKRHLLAELLAQKDPKALIFSDEPEKLYYAIPEGDTAIDDIMRAGTGTINWIVPDGVSYDVNPRIFSNISIDSAENQVLDPEFRKKDKYYKLWTIKSSGTYQGHNILGADFTNTNTIADKGEVKYNGFYIMQNSNSTAR